MNDPRLWGEPGEVVRNCEDAIQREALRLHPTDRVKVLRDVAKHCETWATAAEKINEKNGVPERGN